MRSVSRYCACPNPAPNHPGQCSHLNSGADKSFFPRVVAQQKCENISKGCAPGLLWNTRATLC